MVRSTLVLSWMLVLSVAVAGQDGDSSSLHEMLVAAKLPQGYQTTTQDVNVDGKVLGKIIVIAKPDQISKVVVRIDLTDRSSVPYRRAAAKAYVNEFGAGFRNAGYSDVEKNYLPDFDKESFEKPVSVGLTFANGEGKKLWTHQEIFFTDKCFVVQVIAEDTNTLASLTKWAKTVKPKTKS